MCVVDVVVVVVVDVVVDVVVVVVSAVMVVIQLDGLPYLCKTDEVGELCVCSGYTGSFYWGLQGLSSTTFQVSRS